jgi:hypothetical protein
MDETMAQRQRVCMQIIHVQVKRGQRPEAMAEENQRELGIFIRSYKLRPSIDHAIEARLADITSVIAVRLAVASII